MAELAVEVQVRCICGAIITFRVTDQHPVEVKRCRGLAGVYCARDIRVELGEKESIRVYIDGASHPDFRIKWRKYRGY